MVGQGVMEQKFRLARTNIVTACRVLDASFCSERLRSPDGELETLNTRQMRFEPLGASDLFSHDRPFNNRQHNKMHAPQIIMLVLIGLFLITHICKHGEERPRYNGPLTFLDCVISVSILYWGGFFG